ncbi:hypothetical protein [Ferruginibacter sp. HRS2-29]|uniref:hypothetical protein n=1 Tax=Ferruginibacter sp. HRS2-29 TaxID=2487334 RepID=UPI0020CC4689|nr:hypothetical protein [Ferruginibacter sp. HRS2-29]MCP9751611.1 hypothetical protein [Ferruginibacter sp. HRS2-29]
MNEVPDMIPEKVSGKHLDLHAEVSRTTAVEAADLFQNARMRLLLPSLWHTLAGSLSAVFALATPGNTDGGRTVKLHDYVTIDIPGPGNSLGDGFDWTQVTALAEDVLAGAQKSVALTLTACANPLNIVQDTAHFFDNSSSSSFVLYLSGCNVGIDYYGRNEQPNRHTISIADNMRNALVATGAAAGLSELQWSSLIRGILNT